MRSWRVGLLVDHRVEVVLFRVHVREQPVLELGNEVVPLLRSLGLGVHHLLYDVQNLFVLVMNELEDVHAFLLFSLRHGPSRGRYRDVLRCHLPSSPFSYSEPISVGIVAATPRDASSARSEEEGVFDIRRRRATQRCEVYRLRPFGLRRPRAALSSLLLDLSLDKPSSSLLAFGPWALATPLVGLTRPTGIGSLSPRPSMQLCWKPSQATRRRDAWICPCTGRKRCCKP